MEKEKEEKKALRQIKEIEEKLQQRMESAKIEARKIIEAAREEAEALLKGKESTLEELRRSLLQGSLPPPEDSANDQNLPSSPAPLVRELGNELFQLLHPRGA